MISIIKRLLGLISVVTLSASCTSTAGTPGANINEHRSIKPVTNTGVDDRSTDRLGRLIQDSEQAYQSQRLSIEQNTRIRPSGEIYSSGSFGQNNTMGETFAANIHDLLANGFFLKNSFMGEYAKQKIKDLLKYLTYKETEDNIEGNEKPELEWNPVLAEEFIEIIGEPLLKYDLKELYLSKFYNEKKIDAEIERLQELKRTM